MNVTITHAKAPWPKGAQVGEVVEIPYAEIPAFLVNKCLPAGDDVEAAHVLPPADPPQVHIPPAPLGIDPGAAKIAEALLAEARAEADELRGMLERANATLAERDATIAELQVQVSSKKAKG